MEKAKIVEEKKKKDKYKSGRSIGAKRGRVMKWRERGRNGKRKEVCGVGDGWLGRDLA